MWESQVAVTRLISTTYVSLEGHHELVVYSALVCNIFWCSTLPNYTCYEIKCM